MTAPRAGRGRAATVARLALAGIAVIALVGACAPAAVSSGPAGGSTTPAARSAAPASPRPAGAACGTVHLALTPWPGAAADVAVVGYLLEHQLGCTVVKVQIDDEVAWQLVGSGGVDAILENWDHEDLAKTYITDRGTAQDAGPSGNEGVVGWFVPRFFAEAHPDILTARTNPAILNAYAAQFRTAQSGEKGQLLDGEPGFVTLDRAMIRGFDLDYTVVYAGDEDAANAAIAAAIDKRSPILAYFVEPSWFSTKVDLVHVELPPYTPGCNLDPEVVACDYPAYHLNKVVSSAFAAGGGPAYELIRRFHWTNADQDAVAASIVDGHLSDDAAAKAWLDTHAATWEAWLP